MQRSEALVQGKPCEEAYGSIIIIMGEGILDRGKGKGCAHVQHGGGQLDAGKLQGWIRLRVVVC